MSYNFQSFILSLFDWQDQHNNLQIKEVFLLLVKINERHKSYSKMFQPKIYMKLIKNTVVSLYMLSGPPVVTETIHFLPFKLKSPPYAK